MCSVNMALGRVNLSETLFGPTCTASQFVCSEPLWYAQELHGMPETTLGAYRPQTFKARAALPCVTVSPMAIE